MVRNSTLKLYRKCLKNTVLRTDSPCHELPNRTVLQRKKVVQLCKALALCLTPVDCRKNCGLRPVVLRYTYSTVRDLHQWKVRCLRNSELDRMQLVLICVFLAQNIMCTFLNRKGTSGTQRVCWVDWSVIWVKMTAIEFGCLTNGRLRRVVMFSSPTLCAIRTTTSLKPKACPTLHVALASHKSNPSSVPQGYVDLYCSLGHVGGGNRC